MKTRLIFVRHAEAEGNFKRIFQGFTDGLITKRGHIQAKLAAERLRYEKIDILYSSSLTRTLQTAGYIAEIKNLEIIKLDGLKEINGGDWEGRNWDELPSIWPKEYDTWENAPHIHEMPNGEAMTEFYSRLNKTIDRIVNENCGKNVCIVTHGTAIKALMCRFMGKTLDDMVNVCWCDNTALTVIEVDGDEFRIITKGDASHLSQEESTLKNQTWWSEYQKRFSDE
jgi:broad specificity phosphatase PhoE